MPKGYERGRSRIARDYNNTGRGYVDDGRGQNDTDPDPGYDYRDGRGGYARYANNGGVYRYLWLGLIVAAAILIVVIVLVVKGLFGSSPTDGEGQTFPPITTHSPDPNGTSGLFETESPPPSESPSAPDGSESPDPGDTDEPDDTASSDPTASPTTHATSPNDGQDHTDALTVPEIQGKAKVTESLSLRKTASSSAEALATIPKDGELTILSVYTTKTWLKVKYDGKTGYVLAKYVSIGESGDGKVCTVTGSTVNVRSGSDTSHNIVGVLKSGDTVIVTKEVSGEGGTWCEIAVGSTTGYIKKEFCRVMDNG
jgi:uncharacterized protein YraI